jgi:hypothetical protein
VQPRRRDALQIRRIRKARERLAERRGTDDLAMKTFDLVRRVDVGG